MEDGEKRELSMEATKPNTVVDTDYKKSTDPTRRRTKDHSMATGSEASVGVDGKTRKLDEPKTQSDQPDHKVREQKRDRSRMTDKPSLSVVDKNEPDDGISNPSMNVPQSESGSPMLVKIIHVNADGKMGEPTLTQTSLVKPMEDGEKRELSMEATKPNTVVDTDYKKSTDPTRRRTKDHSMATGSEASVGVDGKTRKLDEPKTQSDQPDHKVREQKRDRSRMTDKPSLSVVDKNEPDDVKPMEDGEKRELSMEATKPNTVVDTDYKKSTDPTRRRTKDHSMATGSEASVGVDGKTRKIVESSAVSVSAEDKLDGSRFAGFTANEFDQRGNVSGPFLDLTVCESGNVLVMPMVDGVTASEDKLKLMPSPSFKKAFENEENLGVFSELGSSDKSPPDRWFSKVLRKLKRRSGATKNALYPCDPPNIHQILQSKTEELSPEPDIVEIRSSGTFEVSKKNLLGGLVNQQPGRADFALTAETKVADNFPEVSPRKFFIHPSGSSPPDSNLQVSTRQFSQEKLTPVGSPGLDLNSGSPLFDPTADAAYDKKYLQLQQVSASYSPEFIHGSKLPINANRGLTVVDKQPCESYSVGLRDKLGHKLDSLKASIMKANYKVDGSHLLATQTEYKQLNQRDQIPTSSEVTAENISQVSPKPTGQLATDGSIKRENSLSHLIEIFGRSSSAAHLTFSEMSLRKSSQHSGDFHPTGGPSQLASSMSQKTSATGMTTKSDDSSETEFCDSFQFEKNYDLPPY
ncbi:hypothetical protein FGIG_05803 [Fasciola gigantica]|uniref:Uncharacterized protein n=1 Tax=Fasciola gigantica TaxID=46835 RepID=A0A504YA53_FASGI|nr:hypothetical protein FGIG_05803 [Fasciola gigantica]